MRAFLSDGGGAAWTVQLLAAALLVAAMAGGTILMVLGGVLVKILGTLLAIGGIAALGAGMHASASRSVAAPRWKYRGQRITGEALTLLLRAQANVSAARDLVGRIPAGVSWEELRAPTDIVLWDAAGHAADACSFEQELAVLRYAESGSAAAEAMAARQREQQAHLEALRRVVDETAELAARAGAAAAASRAALARDNDVERLSAARPQVDLALAELNSDELTTAKDRLTALSQAWEELA